MYVVKYYFEVNIYYIDHIYLHVAGFWLIYTLLSITNTKTQVSVSLDSDKF